MRIGVLGTGRIGLVHARNLAQTTGVDEVVLMGRSQARLAVSVEHVCAAIQPDAPPIRTGSSSTSIDRPTDPTDQPKGPNEYQVDDRTDQQRPDRPNTRGEYRRASRDHPSFGL